MDSSVHGSLGGGDPVVWVEPGDSEDEEEVSPTTKGLSHAVSMGGVSKAAFDDALLGKINRMSAEGKRISMVARQNDPVLDIRSDKFDPCKYLSAVHKETPRSRVETGVERLQKMAGQGGKVSKDSKMLIRNNFGRFVAAHDKMQALRSAIVEIDGKSLDELEATLDAVAGESESVFKPMLELQQRTAAIRSALAVLDRHQALFLLAAQIKEDGAAGEYDKVVASWVRARDQLGGVKQGMMLYLMEEVEAQVDIVRRALRRKLGDAEATVQELSKAVHFLGKLDPEGRGGAAAPKAAKRRGKEGPLTIRGECMRLQQEAVMQMMQRSIGNFRDQVSKLEHNAEDAVQQGDFSLTDGGDAGEQHLARMVNVFEGLATALVSSLSSIVGRHAQRLIALEEAGSSDKQQQQQQVQFNGSSTASPPRNTTPTRLFLDKLLAELVDTLGEALHPIFVNGCTVQHLQLKMSHLATLNALDTVCQSRAQLDRVWECPAELLARFDDVIIALCTATLEEDFQQMHRQLEQRFLQHKRLDRLTWRRDMETGASELPEDFRALLLQGIHRVHGLVAPSSKLRAVGLTLCIRSMEGLLDLLHDLALGPELDSDTFLRHWAVRQPGLGGADAAPKEPAGTAVPGAAAAVPLALLHYPLSGAGPVGAGRAMTGEEGVQMLLMVLADVVYLRKNVEGILEECAEALQPHANPHAKLGGRSGGGGTLQVQEDTQVVAEAGIEVLHHLCSTLEGLIEDKFVRGCALAVAAAVESGIKTLPPKSRTSASGSGSGRESSALASASSSDPGHPYLPAPDDTRPFVEELLQILVRASASFRTLGVAVQEAVLGRLVEALWRAVALAVRETRSGMEQDPKSHPTLVQVAAALQIHADLHFLSSGLHRFEKREDGSSRAAAVMEPLSDWLELLGVSNEDAEQACKAAVRDSTYRCKMYLECFRG